MTSPNHSVVPLAWRRLVDALGRSHPHLVREASGSVRFVVVTRERPIRVGIRVVATTIYDQDAIVVAADLGPSQRVDAVTALQINGALVHGTLVVQNDVLYLRSMVALATETTMMEHAIRLLAAEAAELKRRLAGVITPAVPTAIASSAFTHFGD